MIWNPQLQETAPVVTKCWGRGDLHCPGEEGLNSVLPLRAVMSPCVLDWSKRLLVIILFLCA